MTEALTVNDAIDRISELNGSVVTVIGRLSLEFEGTCIEHIPKQECRANVTGGPFGIYPSSIWLTYDYESLNQRVQGLRQFDGRHVQVTGKLIGPLAEFGGCGHFSLWPAELFVTEVEKYKKGSEAG